MLDRQIVDHLWLIFFNICDSLCQRKSIRVEAYEYINFVPIFNRLFKQHLIVELQDAYFLGLAKVGQYLLHWP